MDEQQRAPLPLEVVTIRSDGRSTRKVIDHNNPADRVWLGKHCFWAFRNGVEIRTKPMEG